ncbi:von Willebrand factor C and EGF domain-containing protein [Camelus ferus]|nr:von Willebrand factor C and EGF domain-containing protein [Camelus ferus]
MILISIHHLLTTFLLPFSDCGLGQLQKRSLWVQAPLVPPTQGAGGPTDSRTQGRRLGPHVCLSGFGSGCCPGWAPSMGSGHCTLPLCSFGCGSGICIAPNVCSCQDGEQGATCPEAHGPCGEYGCDLTCNHGGCQEVARVCPVGFSMTETAVGIRCTDIDECLSSSCEGHCVNTEGGFVCECGPGMQLSADRHSCQDTDECLGTPCQQRCKNSIGSYRCSCRTGFHLHGNRHSCVAFPKAVLAPSAILQPLQHPPKMLLLIPEAGRPALSPGHSPPSGAPGPPVGVRPTRLPSPTPALPVSSPSAPTQLLSTPTAIPVPSASLLWTLRPPSQLQEKVVVTPSMPRGPEATRLAPAPPACWHLGAMYESGSRWTEPGCSQCWCQLRKDRELLLPFSAVRCYFHGRWYADGAVFSGVGDECTTCVCQNGEVECSFTPCPELDCPREEWWLGPGQCCFTCRKPTPMTGCTYTGRIFYNNQTFPSMLDPCLSCICLLGSVACSPVDCPITCTYPFHPDGECCPVCLDCNYEGRKVGNGQVFTLDDEPCTQCICQLGEVSCEEVPCQRACSDPSTPAGDCCSSCPDSLEESRGLSPRGDMELSKAARSPRGDTEAPVNCSSCPGPPAASPQRPALQLLQLLLRTNLSNMQTLPASQTLRSLCSHGQLGPPAACRGDLTGGGGRWAALFIRFLAFGKLGKL